MHSATIKKVLQTPEDWLEVGIFLADETTRTFGNGSHQFIADAVPALVDSGLAKTKDEFKRGVELLGRLNDYEHGELSYDYIARMMMAGQIRSLDEINNFPIPYNRRTY